MRLDEGTFLIGRAPYLFAINYLHFWIQHAKLIANELQKYPAFQKKSFETQASVILISHSIAYHNNPEGQNNCSVRYLCCCSIAESSGRVPPVNNNHEDHRSLDAS